MPISLNARLIKPEGHKRPRAAGSINRAFNEIGMI